jgi:hypothetical protein
MGRILLEEIIEKGSVFAIQIYGAESVITW